MKFHNCLYVIDSTIKMFVNFCHGFSCNFSRGKVQLLGNPRNQKVNGIWKHECQVLSAQVKWVSFTLCKLSFDTPRFLVR